MIKDGNGQHLAAAQLTLASDWQATWLSLPLGECVTEIVARDDYFDEFASLILAEHSRRE